FFFSSRRRHTRSYGDWSSDVCSSDLLAAAVGAGGGQRVDGALEGVEGARPPPGGDGERLVVVVAAHVALGHDITPRMDHPSCPRSEERRVGKECRSRSVPEQ